MPTQPVKRKPGRPKAIESTETMNTILRTAAFQFMEHGFEKVSLADVAKTCGVTKASVYYYFSNKSDLFTAALIFILQSAYKQSAIIINADEPLPSRLLSLAVSHMSNAHVEFETMMREASSALSEEQTKKIRDSEAAIHILLSEMFQQEMDKGTIGSHDPLLLAYAFTGLLTVRNRKEVIHEQHTVEQAAEKLIKLFINGIAPHAE